jgi:hypothetical protein
MHLLIGTTNKKVCVVTKIININRNPKHILMFPLKHFPVVTYFILLISFPCLSQEIEYQGYKSIPFISDVWRVEYKGAGDSLVGVIYPKKGKYFKMNFIPVRDKINKDKVNDYLLPSFNQFRKEHGLGEATENDVLTVESTNWAKQIPNIMFAQHSKLSEHPLKKESDMLSEGICSIPYTQLTLVPDSMDINKVLADCIFDALSICPAHSRNLVYDCENYEIGFGLDYRPSEVIVVLQYRQKKSY